MVVLLSGLSGAALAADAEAEFYKDKQIRMIVPTPSGGLYDLFTRLMAEHMPRHIPGNPKVIVQNMGGAGGLVAANHMANVAPRDGTVLAAARGRVTGEAGFLLTQRRLPPQVTFGQELIRIYAKQ